MVSTTATSAAPMGPRASLPIVASDAAARAAAAASQAEVAATLGDAAQRCGARLLDAWVMGGAVVQSWRLASGLHVVLAPDPSSSLVAYQTWFHVGSAVEVPGQTGIAHLLEHLMFKASARYPAGAFDRVLERMGASPNAATWLDWTMYHQTIVPDALAEVAAMEGDRMQGLRLDAAAFRSELAVVRSERREVVDGDPEGRLDEAFDAAFWGIPGGYGHPTVGLAADLKGMKRDAVMAFYRRWYRPAHATVVLAGAVDPRRDLPAICRAYADIAAPDAVAPSAPPVPIGPAPLRPQVEVRVDAGADRVLVGWRAMPGDDARHAALSLLADILGNHDASRLDRALVEEGRLATEVDVDAPAMARGGALLVRVQLRAGVRAETALARLEAEIAALLTTRPISEGELQGARNRLAVQRFRGMQTVDGRAELLGMGAATFGSPTWAEAWWRAVQAVDVAALRAVAAVVLRPQGRLVAIGRATRAPVEAEEGASDDDDDDAAPPAPPPPELPPPERS